MDIALALSTSLEHRDFREAMVLLFTKPPTRLDTSTWLKRATGYVLGEKIAHGTDL